MSAKITNIVFTRNRPLQLHGYLESLYRHFPSQDVQTVVLYKRDRLQRQYEELFARFAQCQVVEESDFHRDFLEIMRQVDSPYVLFGVDDVVFFDAVEVPLIIDTFERYGSQIFGFSLRLGVQMLHSWGDQFSEHQLGRQCLYSFDWRHGRAPTTRYPFELCATVYPTQLVRRLIGQVVSGNRLASLLFGPGGWLVKALGPVISPRAVMKRFGYFFNPNTLESWVCRWCQRHGERLPPRLFFQRQCAAAIQVNLVNTSTANPADNAPEHTVEVLGQMYQQGYLLDIDFIKDNPPETTHCGKEKFRLVLRP